MKRALPILACLALLLTSEAHAQRFSGLEMSIEGALTAVEDEEQLLLVTLHGVSGADELRPAAGANLKVTASYRADGPIAELQTDRHGRAAIRYTPEGEGNFEIVIDAFHGDASRRFRVPIGVVVQPSLHLQVLPQRPQPGGAVLVFGYALDPIGRPIGAGRAVRLVSPGREPVVVRTNADGAFVAKVLAPEEVGAATIDGDLEAVNDDNGYLRGAGGQIGIHVTERTMHRGLRARALPRQRIVGPRESIAVDVEVRDGLGRPVRASVTREGSSDDAVVAEDGHASFEWTAPSISGIHDEVARFRVSLPGEAPVTEQVTIRVASVPAAADVAPESGALVPGVPSRLFVKAVRADGSPYSGPVTLSAPRFGDATLTTDPSGYGAVEVTLGEEATTDACGGVTALAVSVAFGDESGQSRCVPIDPDAALRTRVSESDGELRVRLHRRRAIGRAPAVVTIFRMRGDAMVPLAAEWVPAGEETLTLERPAPGPLWVRARPRLGPGEAEVRGTFARVAGRPAPAVRVSGGAAHSDETDAIASLVAPATSALRYERSHRAPDALALARTVPRDIGAPFRLVGGEARPAAPLDEPVKLAVLRDPWRQRALFRSGRLALLFRELEQKVEEASSGGERALERFTHASGGRRRFNESVLAVLDRSGQLGPEGARDLGGEPLTIARLRAMDRAFSFDAVARRVTRKRLIEELAQWRPWVHDRDLDPAFAPHADPRHWWATYCEAHSWTRDGWGRLMQLRPLRRPRDPGTPVVVPGWAITSAGPDGRFGTGDDLVDPFARVVPEGVYAESVDEAGLVQALRRGVLDRETVRLLDAGQLSRRNPANVRNGLPEPLAVEPAPFLAAHVQVSAKVGDGSHDVTLPPASVPHRLLAIAMGGARGIGLASAPMEASAGARIALHPPARLHRSTPLRLPVVVVAASRTEGLGLDVSAEGATVALAEPSLGTLDAGQALERLLRLEAAPGSDRATVTLTLRRGAEPVAERRLEVAIVDGFPERTLWAGAAVDGEWKARYPIPEGAAAPRTRLVLTAPGRLDADPHLAYGPIARAWARLMAGEGESVHLTDLPERADDPVEAARLSLLQTALAEPGRRPTARFDQRAIRDMDTDGRSRVLAVLSSLALPRFTNPPERGPARIAHQLREQLWRVHESEGATLARMAAALLLTDLEDPNGRAAFVRARQTMEPAGLSMDAQVVPAEDPRDRLAGSVALALAAHLSGDERTRDRLLRGLGRRTHLAADRTGDGAFWLLTAAAHGTFGRGEGSATLRTNGSERAIAFDDGLAIVPIEESAAIELELTTRGGVHLARIETRYGRPVEATEDSPLRVAVEGIDGRAGRRAGYEIVVSANAPVERPVLAITLPPGAELEPEALAAMGASDVVAAIAPADARGVLRLELATLAAEQEHRFPLPLRWAGAGPREGLAIAAWERERPWQVSSIPARSIDVRE